ncbi:MAG: aminoglycoside phosphotransferase family protein [Bacteroidetes bacterium]|nr:aminoglycoside phosphotransferase family protein [Bacteroidota bacterium]
MVQQLMQSDPSGAIRNFRISGEATHIGKLGQGHINDTFLVLTNTEQAYVLQRINHMIFRDVPSLMHNISRVCRHLNACAQSPSPEQRLLAPEIVEGLDGRPFVCDAGGNYWRCMTYIAHTPPGALTSHLAREAGRAIGLFQNKLSSLPGEPLADTIPNFHNLQLRLHALHQAIATDPAGRKQHALNEMNALLRRQTEMLRADRLLAEGTLPLRVVHNDTKLNNILFDENGKAIAIVDLDTVMNGSVIYDFGDAVRTLCNTAGEDESRLELVGFDQALFGAFAEGYLMQTAGLLQDAEIEHLAFGCKLLPYLMAVRFLTDYLLGDVYYKISSPMQNLHRASNQIRFVECIENSYPALEQTINRILGR